MYLIQMKKIVVLLLVLTSGLMAQDNKSNDWLTGDDAIVLLDETMFEISDDTEAKLTKHVTIRINNENGKKYTQVVIEENKYYQCEDISATIKDTNRTVLLELDEDEIIESSFTPGYTLHSDANRLYFELNQNTYPYIFEYFYTIEYSTLYFWPDWYPQQNIPVLKSTYKLILEEDIKFNTHQRNIDIEPEKKNVDGNTSYFWRLDSIAKRKDEPLQAPEDVWSMKLMFVPEEFKFDDYEGSFKSWKDFGKWFIKLTEGRYDLPSEALSDVNKLLSDNQSDYEKINILYSYLQDKTRYVAIELGIGGYQPYSASWVYNNRFGDCKDLTTFMISLLKCANIKGYPTLVLTRDDGVIIEEFPSDYFNHVITCVPLEKDTIWIETTTDLLKAGEMNWTIEDCNVLLIKDTGGILVKTPKSKSIDNSWKSHIRGEIKPKGTFNFSGTVRFIGNQKNYQKRNWIHSKSNEYEDWLRGSLLENIPALKISNYEFLDDKNTEKKFAVLKIEGSSEKFAHRTGRRLFINPNIFHRRTGTIFDEDEERKDPIHLNYAYSNADTVTIKLPYGYSLEAAPENINFDKSFGCYNSFYKMEQDIFTYVRYFEHKTNHIASEDYAEYVKFIKDVINKDQAKYVFRKF